MGLVGSKKVRTTSFGKSSNTLLSNETELQTRVLDYHDEVILGVIEGEMDRKVGFGQLCVLPDECLLRILSFLPIEDICGVSCVSKAFFVLGRDEWLWKTIYKTRGVYNAGFDDPLGGWLIGKKKRKKRRCGRAKWRDICFKNMLCLPETEPVILNEQILGIPFDRVEDLLGQFDEVTNVARGSAYYFFHSVGLSVCCEDSKVTSVLKNTPLPSCDGPAYEKIVPLSS